MPDMNIPYIRFESRPVEDREATIKAGRKIYKDVDFVIITPPGRKDEVEKEAVDWLKDVEKKSLNRDRSQFGISNAYPLEVIKTFQTMYEMYKRDEVTEDLIGTPLKVVDWLSESEKRNCLGANIRTLEDLASATEEGLSNIGMGGRELKRKAINAMESAEGGKTALKIEALEQKIIDLTAMLEKQSKKKVKEEA